MRSLLDRTPLMALLCSLVCCSLLVACDRDPIAPATPPSQPPASSSGQVLGLVEVTISGIGSGDMHASAAAVGHSVPGTTARGLSLDLTPVPGADGSIQLDPVSTGSFTEGDRGHDGQRYLYATFKVRNATSGGTAYSTPRTNLTFLAVSTPSTIEGTAISQMNKFDGSAADPGIALQLLPTGAVTQNPATGQRSSASPDVLQVLTEAEAASFTAPPSVTTVFPYGFVVRNASAANSRMLPASPAPDQFDGIVTFAFRVPLQASSSDDPFTVSAMFVAVDDGETRLTQSLEEQDAAATNALVARAHALNASELTLLPGGSGGGVPVRRVCSVRTAGPADAPTATLVSSTGALLQSLSPDPYATDGSGSFIASPTSITAHFSDAITATPTAENFVVNGSQSGRHFLGQSYDGAGTNTITTPSGTFFPGEEVEVVLTSALEGCGTPKVARLRVKAPTASSGPSTVGRSFDVSGTSLAVADLNGDGKLDAMTTGANAVEVLLGDGAGAFQAPVDYAVGGEEPQLPAAGDLNGDGALDIVMANMGSNSVSVLLGAGDGTFPTHTEYAVVPFPKGVAIGDVNGDGKLDLVVAGDPDELSQQVGGVSVLLGNGDGTFQTHKEYATAWGTYRVQLADLGNDGTLDIITVNQQDEVTHDASGNAISVLLGNGDGTFQRHVEHSLPPGYYPMNLAVGDVNADGYPDLVIGDRAFQRADVSVLLSDRYGSLGSPVQISTGGPGYVTGVAISDVNGDGKMDIVAASQGQGVNQYGSISVLFGQGDGTFPTNTQLPAGTPYPIRVATGDLNGDGKLDVILTQAADGRSWIATRMNQ